MNFSFVYIVYIVLLLFFSIYLFEIQFVFCMFTLCSIYKLASTLHLFYMFTFVYICLPSSSCFCIPFYLFFHFVSVYLLHMLPFVCPHLYNLYMCTFLHLLNMFTFCILYIFSLFAFVRFCATCLHYYVCSFFILFYLWLPLK